MAGSILYLEEGTAVLIIEANCPVLVMVFRALSVIIFFAILLEKTSSPSSNIIFARVFS